MLAVVRVVDGEVARRHTIAVAELRDAGLELLQRVGAGAVQLEDDGPARNSGGAEHVARIGDVGAPRRHVEVPGLLIRESVHHRIAEFRVGARGNRVQISHRQLRGYELPTALELHLDLATHRGVQHLLERLELRDEVPVDSQQDVTGL